MNEYPVEQRLMHVRLQAADLVRRAKELGVVITVSQVPRQPFAMGSYDTVVEVRPARGES